MFLRIKGIAATPVMRSEDSTNEQTYAKRTGIFLTQSNDTIHCMLQSGRGDSLEEPLR